MVVFLNVFFNREGREGSQRKTKKPMRQTFA